MNKFKKWVTVLLVVFGGAITSMIVLGMIAQRIGFLWAFFIVGSVIASFFIFSKIVKKNNLNYNLDIGKIKNVMGAIIIIVFAGGVAMFVISDSSKSSTVVKEPTVTAEEKVVARQKLNEYFDLAKTAGLVTSYEFSERTRTVYVGSAWYSQTVVFKKNFLGFVASQQEIISGRNFFELHDAYSNEKVAEVTAFGGSLKVYR